MSDLICYCFGYNSEDIEQDFLSNGKSTIFERIMVGPFPKWLKNKPGDANVQTKIPKVADAYLMSARWWTKQQ